MKKSFLNGAAFGIGLLLVLSVPAAFGQAFLGGLEKNGESVVNPGGYVLVEVIEIIIDEFNILRTWDRDLKTATAASNNLSQFKANVAALPELDDRTLSQLKAALCGQPGIAGPSCP